MRILIAEDESVSRKLLEATLIKWGHEVISCTNGAEALDYLQRDEGPRLAILDWMMPELEGPAICKILRANEKTRHAYVILLTSRRSPEDLVQGLESGADDYVMKPFNQEELRVRLQAGIRILTLQEQALANEQARVLVETAGAAAHEINQPLSVVMGISELWLGILSEADDLRSDAEHVYESACRIRSIVQQMQSVKTYATTDYVGSEKVVNFWV